jgi:hypothetical protein
MVVTITAAGAIGSDRDSGRAEAADALDIG